MPKPYFFYANGTSFALSVFGAKVIPTQGPVGTIKGYNGRTAYWNGQEWNDPFYKLLDPDKWNAVRIDYPAALIPGWQSLQTGVTNTLAAINALPAGTPYALGGYSQGAGVMSLVLKELQTNTGLRARYADLKAGTMFGNPCRQVNKTWGAFKSYSGGRFTGSWDSSTGGHGAYGAALRLTNTPSYWYEFSGSRTNPVDIINSVSDSANGVSFVNFTDMFLRTPIIASLTLLLNPAWQAAVRTATSAFPAGIAGLTVPSFNGHGDYPLLPPPGYAATDPTSYQIALEYLDMIADSVYTVPKYVPPVVVTTTTPVTTRPVARPTGGAPAAAPTTTTSAPAPQPAVTAGTRIYTFGGTSSLGVTLDGKVAIAALGSGQLAANVSSLVDYNQQGYGVAAAKGVAAVNPNLVEWVPVNYAAAVYPMNVSVQAAVDKTVSMILNKPGKIYLSGTSQGAYVTSQLYREFLSGRLTSRKADLVRIYNYGNPLRQTNMYHASVNPGGHGCAGPEFRLTNTDPNIIWEFANPGDPVTIQQDDQKGIWAKTFFEILNQNVNGISNLNTQLAQFLFTPFANLPTLISFIQDLGNNMLNQEGKHNEYENFYPITGVNKTSVQLAIDDMLGIANPITVTTTALVADPAAARTPVTTVTTTNTPTTTTTTTTTTTPTTTTTTTSSVSAVSPVSKSPWSIAVPNALSLSATDLATIFAGIRALKFEKTRIPVSWATVNTAKTTYNWVAVDAAVNAALTAGLQPMLVLAPPRPAWANPATSDVDFGTFATALAARYRPGGAGIANVNAGKGVLEYQVWDEPNVSENPTTGVNLTSTTSATARAAVAINYVAYLKAAYNAIRLSQPTAVVVFGGLQACNNVYTTTNTGSKANPTNYTYTNVNPVTFLTDCYTAGVRGSFDIMAYHPLSMTTRTAPTPPAPSGKSIQQSDELRAVMTSLGDNKPMYWSAVGYDTNIFTETQQQAYLETLRWLAQERTYVTGFCIYGYRDY